MQRLNMVKFILVGVLNVRLHKGNSVKPEHKVKEGEKEEQKRALKALLCFLYMLNTLQREMGICLYV